MKALTIALILVATMADAQTITKARERHNRRVCALAKLPATCTQAEFNATGKANGTIYATDAAFRDAEIVKPRVDAESEASKAEALAKLSEAFQSLTPAKRVAVCTAAELPEPEEVALPCWRHPVPSSAP